MAKASQKRSSFPECREILDEPESSSNEHIIKIPTTGVHAVLTCRDENVSKDDYKFDLLVGMTLFVSVILSSGFRKRRKLPSGYKRKLTLKGLWQRQLIKLLRHMKTTLLQ